MCLSPCVDGQHFCSSCCPSIPGPCNACMKSRQKTPTQRKRNDVRRLQGLFPKTGPCGPRPLYATAPAPRPHGRRTPARAHSGLLSPAGLGPQPRRRARPGRRKPGPSQHRRGASPQPARAPLRPHSPAPGPPPLTPSLPPAPQAAGGPARRHAPAASRRTGASSPGSVGNSGGGSAVPHAAPPAAARRHRRARAGAAATRSAGPAGRLRVGAAGRGGGCPQPSGELTLRVPSVQLSSSAAPLRTR